MRKIVLLAFCFVLLSAAVARAEEKFAVFDLQKVAAECEALQAAKSAIEEKFGSKRQELEKERSALEKKSADFSKKKPTEKQIQDFTKQQREYQEKTQAFMRLLQADEIRVRTDIDSLIRAASKALAERDGYTMIFDVMAVPYFDAKLDISPAMLAATNEEWKKMQADGAAQTKPQGNTTPKK